MNVHDGAGAEGHDGGVEPTIRRSDVKGCIIGGCLRKAPFVDFDEAMAARQRMVHDRQSSRLRVYSCPYSRAMGVPAHFHIGRQPSLPVLRQIAAAMRWIAANNEVPVADRTLVKLRRRLERQRAAA